MGLSSCRPEERLRVLQHPRPLPSSPVIRLRELLERGMRHRWLGPAVVVLVAILLVLVVMHTTTDQATEASVVCVAFLVILVAVLFPPPSLLVIQVVRPRPPRAPPEHGPAQNLFLTVAPPLRL